MNLRPAGGGGAGGDSRSILKPTSKNGVNSFHISEGQFCVELSSSTQSNVFGHLTTSFPGPFPWFGGGSGKGPGIGWSRVYLTP